MATVYKSENTSTSPYFYTPAGGSAGWSSNDLAVFTVQAANPTVASASQASWLGVGSSSNSAWGGSLQITSAANGGFYLQGPGTSDSSTVRIYGRDTPSTGPANVIDVAANKHLRLDANLVFIRASSIGPAIHTVNLNSGASLVLNWRGNAAGPGYLGVLTDGAARPTALKLQGSGTFYVGRANTTAYESQTQICTLPITIGGGTLQCDGATAADPFGQGAITFNADAGSTARMAFVTAAAPFNATSRTVANTLAFTTAGTISVDGTFTATLSGSVTGSGTLTKEGAGTAIFTTASYPTNQGLTVTGGTLRFNTATTALATSQTISISSGATLQCSAARAIAASTITGAGTLTLANSSFINPTNGSGFTGTINGDFTTQNGGVTLGAQITGAVTTASGSAALTYTGTHSGYIAAVNYITTTVNGRFSAGGVPRTTILNANSGASNSFARLVFDGNASGFDSNIGINMTNFFGVEEASVWLKNGANLNSNITGNTASSNANGTLLSSEEGTNTYTGNINTTLATGNFKIRSKTGGTLTMSGNHTSNGRVFALNSDAGYAGKIVMTGGSFSGPVTLPRGTLHINSASGVGIGSTLTVSNEGTTVACSSSNATYAAQIVGNLSMGANTVLKFGAPA